MMENKNGAASQIDQTEFLKKGRNSMESRKWKKTAEFYNKAMEGLDKDSKEYCQRMQMFIIAELRRIIAEQRRNPKLANLENLERLIKKSDDNLQIFIEKADPSPGEIVSALRDHGNACLKAFEIAKSNGYLEKSLEYLDKSLENLNSARKAANDYLWKMDDDDPTKTILQNELGACYGFMGRISLAKYKLAKYKLAKYRSNKKFYLDDASFYFKLADSHIKKAGIKRNNVYLRNNWRYYTMSVVRNWFNPLNWVRLVSLEILAKRQVRLENQGKWPLA